MLHLPLTIERTSEHGSVLPATRIVSEARRQLRYTEFVEHWDRLLASQFRERVEAALA